MGLVGRSLTEMAELRSSIPPGPNGGCTIIKLQVVHRWKDGIWMLPGWAGRNHGPVEDDSAIRSSAGCAPREE